MKWLGSDHWLLPDGRHLLLCKAKVLGVGPGTFADFTGGTDDGYIYGFHTDYATSRTTSYASDVSASAVSAGQWKSGSYYMVLRAYLSFDTSGVPDDATIADVKLYLCVSADNSDTDCVIQIHKFDWASPIAAGNREANFDVSGSSYDQDWRSSNGISAESWYANSTSLDTSWVSKTGTTRYVLRSDNDVNASAPTGKEYVQFYSASATGKEPYLAITYSELVTKSQQFQWSLRNSVTDVQEFAWDLRTAVSDSQQFQWVLGNAMITDQQFQWTLYNSASDSQQFQWALRNVMSDTQALTWQLLNEISDSQQFQWDIGDVVSKAQTFSWLIGGLAEKAQTFFWAITYDFSVRQTFVWRLGEAGAPVYLGMPDVSVAAEMESSVYLGMPDATVEVEIE